MSHQAFLGKDKTEQDLEQTELDPLLYRGVKVPLTQCQSFTSPVLQPPNTLRASTESSHNFFSEVAAFSILCKKIRLTFLNSIDKCS